jgi:hypothetical protein
MLRVEARDRRGRRGILSAFSAMAEDSIGDDEAAMQSGGAGLVLFRPKAGMLA